MTCRGDGAGLLFSSQDKRDEARSQSLRVLGREGSGKGAHLQWLQGQRWMGVGEWVVGWDGGKARKLGVAQGRGAVENH